MVGPNQVQIGKGSAQPTDTQHTPTFGMPPPKPKKIQKPKQPKRKTTKVPQPSGSIDIAADEAVHKDGVIVCSQGTSSGDVRRHQDTMGDTSAHTSLKHIELIKIYTTPQKKFLDLEDELKRTKTAQQTKIAGLERRVMKLKKKHMSRTHKLKKLYKERIDEIDADKDIALVSTHDDMIQYEGIEDVSVAKTIVTTALTITAESTKTNVEEDIQAKVDVDYQLAKRLQAKEQEQLTDAEKAKLFMEFIEKRRKFFVAKRTTKKRNKPPTKAQQRSIMSTYMKNIDGWKPRALKKKSFAEIKELFDKAMERINNFIDFRTKLVEVSTKKDEAVTAQEISSKRVRDKLNQERSKKKKV
nr:hypothetical protein [Tanacetum cinerariifolium]